MAVVVTVEYLQGPQPGTKCDQQGYRQDAQDDQPHPDAVVQGRLQGARPSRSSSDHSCSLRRRRSPAVTSGKTTGVSTSA